MGNFESFYGKNVGGTVTKLDVKSDTFSGTTTSLGQLVLYSGNDRIPLSIEISTIPANFKNADLMIVTGGGIVATAFNTSNAAFASQALSGKYYYIEI